MLSSVVPMWMPSLDDLSRLGPIFSLVGTMVAILLAALIVGRNWRVTGGLALIGGLVTGWLAWRGWASLSGSWAGMTPSSGATAPVGPMLVADQASYFFTFLLSIFLVLITGLWFHGREPGAANPVAHRRDAVEFFILLVGSAFGMALMVSTTNILMIILAVEAASLPSYGLAGFRKQNRLAAEASLKYILFGAVTSAIMIYGASLLYGRYHTLDLLTLGREVAAQRVAVGGNLLLGVGLVAFLVGMAFKISAVPFHFWCPDVFEGASIEVTTWLSVVSKGAGLCLLFRVLTVVALPTGYPPEALPTAAGAGSVSGAEIVSSGLTMSWVTVALCIMAIITCTVGNLAAYHQTNLKRLLAFSSIAHAGYMLMAVAVAGYTTRIAPQAAHPAFSIFLAYITVYLVMNFGAFACVAMVYWATGKETLDAFRGLARRSPVIAVGMVACLFSLVGLPPMAGFTAKWWLLLGLYQIKSIGIEPIGLILVIVAVVNTLISLYFYARIAYAMCFEDDGQPAIRTPLLGRVAVTACAVVILLFGTVWAGKLMAFSNDRAKNLYAVTAPQAPAHRPITIVKTADGESEVPAQAAGK